MNRYSYSIRGLRMDGTTIIWDEQEPEFFGVYARELFDELETHARDFDTRVEAEAFIASQNPVSAANGTEWNEVQHRIENTTISTAWRNEKVTLKTALPERLHSALEHWQHCYDLHQKRFETQTLEQLLMVTGEYQFACEALSQAFKEYLGEKP